MKKEEINKVMEDTNWIRITWFSGYGRGEMIIKQSLYEIKIKKIDKELKGLTWYIDYNYQLTLDDVLSMDRDLNRYKRAIDHYDFLFEITTNQRRKDEYANESQLYQVWYEERLKELTEEFKRKEDES